MNERARQQEAAASRIAFAVRQRRKSLGITQHTLAQRAGCGLVFVYNIEHGKPSLRFDKLLDVLDVLGLELVVKAGEPQLRAAREITSYREGGGSSEPIQSSSSPPTVHGVAGIVKVTRPSASVCGRKILSGRSLIRGWSPAGDTRTMTT